MSVATGPNQVNNGLVFQLDMYNSRSEIGAATTNVLPNPQFNGRFTTDNQWGTYNVNQYNNNTYFSIGTISSVTGNIVTTASAHPFRTYDVVTPQTTGGGVTAGTNYFVKVISSTQFSLHAYNSSQDGSQGYVNPATGNFKVYDSIALNQQVSINSTSFPTMWWGPPHLPNSGLVKEIVVGGGYVPGTNCMRLHIPRALADGMAYGVYTQVTAGDIITVSYWVKATDSRGDGQTLGYSTYFGANSAFSGSTVLTQSWQKVVFTWTASATFTFYQYWWPPSVVCDIDMADLQVELNTGGIASPFTIGTRPNTRALLDAVGTNTITVSSLTYTNDNTYSFNGSSNYLYATGSGFTSGMTAYTISFWARRDAENRMPVSSYTGTSFYWYGDNSWRYTHGGVGGEYYYSKPTSIPLGTWGHYCVVYDGTAVKIYRQGVYQGQQATTGTADWSMGMMIGYWQGGTGYQWQGRIDNVAMYNRALSADEVTQNFNALRIRYGL